MRLYSKLFGIQLCKPVQMMKANNFIAEASLGGNETQPHTELQHAKDIMHL